MAVVGVNLPLHAGVAGTYLIYLRSAGVLLNTGGDTLTESTGGYFTGTVAEAFVADVYRADVTLNGTLIYSGWLVPGQSLIVDSPATVAQIAAAAGLGTGATARDIVVTVEDEDEEGVAGARLHVLTDGEVATNLAPTTGVGGAATLRLNDGDYILRVVSPSGFATVADIEFTVDSSETPIAVTLDSTTVTPTPEAGLCTVYTTVLDPSGEFMEGATMRARLVDPNSGPNGAVVTNESIEAESDEEGYVSLDLIRADQFADGTGEYQITVSYAGEILRNITVTIPNQDSVNLEDLATS